MTPQPLVVLFEDAHVLAVVKPAGVLTQRNLKGMHALEDDVRAYLESETPRPVYLGTVHRLDRPVSGVMLWAKTRKAAQRLSGQFGRREVTKEYLGLFEDLRPAADPLDSVWINWLTPTSNENGVVLVVDPDTPGARLAETRVFEDSGSIPGKLLRLRLSPVTGRTHQLRVQAATRGFPVLGDVAYGSTRPFPAGIALHARSLRFRHPTLLSPMELIAPVPDSWPS